MAHGVFEKDGSGGEPLDAHSCDGWPKLRGDDILRPVEPPVESRDCCGDSRPATRSHVQPKDTKRPASAVMTSCGQIKHPGILGIVAAIHILRTDSTMLSGIFL